MKIYIILIALILMTQFVVAEDIASNPITIHIYNNSIEVKQYSSNAQNFSFMTSNNLVNDTTFNYNCLFIDNRTQLINIDIFNISSLTQQLLTCSNDRLTLNLSLINCQVNTNAKDNISIQYTNCLVDKKDRELTIQNKDLQISTLTTQATSSKNSVFMWAAIAAGAGVLGTLVVTGKLGGFIMDKQKQEFNPRSAG